MPTLSTNEVLVFEEDFEHFDLELWKHEVGQYSIIGDEKKDNQADVSPLNSYRTDHFRRWRKLGIRILHKQ